MEKKFKVITLCGSSKFKKEFTEVAEKLSLEGNIVISLGLFGHADNKFDTVITSEIKEMLDAAHRQKIKMSDAIYVINPGGYIGMSTRREIHYARALGKEIIFLEEPTFKFKDVYHTYGNLLRALSDRMIEPDGGDIYFVISNNIYGEKDAVDIYGEPLLPHSFVAYDPGNGGFYKIALTDAKITLKDPYPYLGDKNGSGKVVLDNTESTLDKCITLCNNEVLEDKINEVRYNSGPADNEPILYPKNTLISKLKLRGSFPSFNELIKRLMPIKDSLKHKDLFQVNGCDGGEDMYGTKLCAGDIIAWISKSHGTNKLGWMKIASENEAYVNGTFETFADLLEFFRTYNRLPDIGCRFEILKSGGLDIDNDPIEAGDIVEYQLGDIDSHPGLHVWKKIIPNIIDLDTI